MGSENQKAIYCEDDGEYRVHCNICDKLCIERFHKNHLKSETHTNNLHTRYNSNNLILTKMRYYCDVCDETVKLKSKSSHLNSLSHKEFDKCKHIKQTIEKPNINDVDKIFYSIIIEHNTK